jgi:hypothetical protein
MTIPSISHAAMMRNKHKIKLRTTPKIKQNWVPTPEEIYYLYDNLKLKPPRKGHRNYINIIERNNIKIRVWLANLIDYCAKNEDSPFNMVTSHTGQNVGTSSVNPVLSGEEILGSILGQPVFIMPGNALEGALHIYTHKYDEIAKAHGHNARKQGLSLKAYAAQYPQEIKQLKGHLDKADIQDVIRETPDNQWKRSPGKKRGLTQVSNGTVNLIVNPEGRLITAYYINTHRQTNTDSGFK